MNYRLIAIFALSAATSVAKAEECKVPWPEAQPTETCDVFGDDADLETNREHRQAQLELVSEGEYCVDLVYVRGWDEDPEIVWFTDLELLDTHVEPDCEPAALVALTADSDDDDEPAVCEAGTYVVEVDDSLGEDGQVLAILDGLVLVELDGELRFLVTADADVPSCWRRIWHPPWRLAPPSRGSTTNNRNNRARNRRNRRNRR